MWSVAGCVGGEGVLEVDGHEELDQVMGGFPLAQTAPIWVPPSADLDAALAGTVANIEALAPPLKPVSRAVAKSIPAGRLLPVVAVGYGGPMSWRWLLVASLAGSVLSAGCSDSTQQSPATAPPTTVAATTTVAAITTSAAPPATTTTISEAAARLAEVEEIFRDLEFRRLDALYRHDEEAFRALFANEAYLEESLGALDLELPFKTAPAPELLDYVTFEILVDTKDCLAASTRVIAPEVLEGESDLGVTVLTLRDDGSWGLAFVGSGWLCDGPHPLDSDG